MRIRTLARPSLVHHGPGPECRRVEEQAVATALRRLCVYFCLAFSGHNLVYLAANIAKKWRRTRLQGPSALESLSDSSSRISVMWASWAAARGLILPVYFYFMQHRQGLLEAGGGKFPSNIVPETLRRCDFRILYYYYY